MTRILVIDDEEGILHSFQKALDEPGAEYEVDTASSGEEGIDKLGKGSFDLVFIDIRMPGMNGIQVLKEARRVSPGTDAAIITGFSTVDTAVEAMKLGALEYVVKPFTQDELLAIVDKILRMREARMLENEEQTGFERWSRQVRIQHIILLTTFILLSITGVPLLFPETFKGVFFFEDSSMLRGLTHRIAAVAMIALSVWHVGWALFNEDGHRNLRAMIPRFPADLKDLWGTILYNLDMREHRPPAGKYNFFEKFEYFAVIWGTLAMVASGLVLWFSDEILRVAPLWVIDVATVVHKYEAILAILSIAIWHMYSVHLRPGEFPMNRVWLDGRISRDDMIEEHPLEYEAITGRRAPSADITEKGVGR
ncbi:MAG: response regulator [Deltaproteobacteria bacterium]|nr:response regulator [Deltaproteobacteria bacterium]